MSFIAQITADVSNFDNNIKKAVDITNDSVSKMQSQFDKLGDSFVKIGSKASILSAAIVGATVGLVKMGTNAGDASAEINNLSTATSLSIDLIQELSYVATASNSSFEGFQSSMDSFQRRLKTVGEEGSRVNEMFGKLGVSTTDASGNVKSMDDVLLETFNKLGDMEEGLAKNAIGAELFGRNWNEVALIVSSGSKGIAELREEANKLGLVLDKNTLQGSDDFATAMGLVGFQIDTLKTKIGSSLVPILQESVLPLFQEKIIPAVSRFADYIAQLSEKFNALSPSTKTAIFALGGIATAIGPVLLGLGGIIKILPLVMAGFTAITGPIGAIVLGLSALTAGIVYFTNRANEATTAADALATVNDKIASSLRKEKAELNQLLTIARDETKSKKDRLDAIQKLNRISPEHLGFITLETVNTEAAKNAVNDYTKAISENARQKAIAAKIEKLYTEQLELEEKIARENEKIEKDKAKGILRSNVLLRSAYQLRKSEFQKELDNVNASIKAYEGLSSQQVKTGESGSNAASAASDALEDLLSNLDKVDTGLTESLDIFQSGKISEAIRVTSNEIRILGDYLLGLQTGKIVVENVHDEIVKVEERLSTLNTALNTLTGDRELNIKVNTDSTLDLFKDTDFGSDAGLIVPIIPQIDTSLLKDGMGDLKAGLTEVAIDVSGMLTDLISGAFASIGDAIVSGDNLMQSLGASLLGGFGGILVSLGEMIVELGTGLLIAKLALKSLNPFIAIAGGAALIAIGSAFASGSRKLSQSIGESGGGYSSAPSMQNSQPSLAGSDYRGAYQDDFKVEFSIGNDALVATLDTAQQRRKRI